MEQYETSHLVASEDLNHHGTLFAARAAAWFVEAGFVAAGQTCGTTEGIVCRNLHDMAFKKPIQKGSIVRFLSRVVYMGKSSFIVYITAENALTREVNIEGMITFVTIDSETKKKREHHMLLDESADETELRQRQAAEKLLAAKE